MNSPGPLPPVNPDAPEHRITMFAWWHVALCVFAEAVTDDIGWHLLAMTVLVINALYQYTKRRLLA